MFLRKQFSEELFELLLVYAARQYILFYFSDHLPVSRLVAANTHYQLLCL